MSNENDQMIEIFLCAAFIFLYNAHLSCCTNSRNCSDTGSHQSQCRFCV